MSFYTFHWRLLRYYRIKSWTFVNFNMISKNLQDNKYKSNIYLSQIILLIYIVFEIGETKPALHEKNVFDFDFMYANFSCLYPTFITNFSVTPKNTQLVFASILQWMWIGYHPHRRILNDAIARPVHLKPTLFNLA